MGSSMSRRGFLVAGLGAATASVLAARRAAAGLAPARYLVVNADDLGLSAEIDQGIFETHDTGIATSSRSTASSPPSSGWWAAHPTTSTRTTTCTGSSTSRASSWPVSYTHLTLPT